MHNILNYKSTKNKDEKKFLNLYKFLWNNEAL